MRYVILLTLVLLCGCMESERIYGLVELPKDWQELFGDGNVSRLDYAQSQRIDAQSAEIKRLNKRLEALEAK